jgi:hypothetical protein
MEVVCSLGESFYARRKDQSVTPYIFVHMARFIMDCPNNMIVDHRNHLTLDNQKENLRICTPSQNQQNQRQHVNSASKYKGVTWHKPNQKWIARIRTKDIFDQSVHIHLGCFKTEEEAALAYDKVAFKEFGKFACLNFPRRNYA